MLEILGRSTSINVRKVLWTCDELGVPYPHEPMGLGELSLRDPEFLALNPNALVPVIRDGDFVLWESNTICRYLASRERAHRSAARRAGSSAPGSNSGWTGRLTELNTAWRYAFMGAGAQERRPLPTRGHRCQRGELEPPHDAARRASCATGAFVAGSAFTLADVVLGLATHRWFMTPMERPDLPAVTAYYDRLDTRPGFRAHGRNGIP